VTWPALVSAVRPSLAVEPLDVLQGITDDALKECVKFKSFGIAGFEGRLCSLLHFCCSGFTKPNVKKRADKLLESELSLVEIAVELVQAGLYYQCNFETVAGASSLTYATLSGMKKERPGYVMCEEAYSLIDRERTSLLLLGKAGRATGFHVDRTQAENMAFPMALTSKVRSSLMQFVVVACLGQVDLI